MKKYSINDFEQSNFYQLPKWLFKEKYKKISNDAKVLYALLKDRFNISLKNLWIDKNGNIYLIFTREEMQDMLQCGRDKIAKLMNELIKNNLVEEKKQGMGKPNLIYLLHPNFSQEEKNEVLEEKMENTEKENIEESIPSNTSLKYANPESIEKTKNSENPTSFEHIENTDVESDRKIWENRSRKNRVLEVGKSDSSKNNIINNNKYIYNNLSIYQKNNINNNKNNKTNQNNKINNKTNCIIKKNKDGLMDRLKAKELLKNNFEYDIVKKMNDIDIEMLDEILELMTDVLISKSETMKINSEEISTEIIKSRFLKLNALHIKYILESIKNNSTQVKNIRAYLLTIIFNSYTTMQNFYSANFNFEFQNIL